MHDLVIRNGLLVDGTGAPGFHGDLAVSDGVIAAVGGKAGAAKREIDAAGCIVTPGFVDVHTHYDAQVIWDPYLTPSSWHGVTSVVMGNCGVGFAPVRPQDREWMIDVMEGIEDIDGASLRAGLTWQWETFPEFMDAVRRSPLAIDVGVQIPHAPLRAYVMGERGKNNEPATADELERMGQLVREAMQAGALGLTGTRSALHKSRSGKPVPGYGVDFAEFIALARAASDAACGGAIGINVNFTDMDEDIRQLRRLRRECGMPVYVLLNQHHDVPGKYAEVLRRFKQASDEGEPLLAQVAGRPICWLMGLTSSRNPFWQRPSYRAIADLTLEQRVARLRDPQWRARLLAEEGVYDSEFAKRTANAFDQMYVLGDPPDYEPDPKNSLAAIARRSGRDVQEVALELMLERDGRELFFMPITNYASGDSSATWDMLHHPCTVLGLGDAGAHVSRICDSSIPSFMLTHWARDRTRGPKMTLEKAVQLQTRATADLYGLHDRGALQPGLKADLNVIDFQHLTLRAPRIAHDQPAGGHRLVQNAQGYVATVVSGVPVFLNGQATGDLPGRLIRSSARAVS